MYILIPTLVIIGVSGWNELRDAPVDSHWGGTNIRGQFRESAGPQSGPVPTRPVPVTLSGAAFPIDEFALQIDEGLYADQLGPLTNELTSTLEYVVGNVGYTPQHFTVMLIRDDRCELFGAAYTEARAVQVYTCNQIERGRAVAILAHEFVHQIAHDRYSPTDTNVDLILVEGFATWGAGKYWRGGYSSFQSYVRDQYGPTRLLPLRTDYFNQGYAVMNQVYYQWGSFVEYLLAAYPPDKFDQLYTSGEGTMGSADYLGIYGHDLDALEAQWRAWIAGAS